MTETPRPEFDPRRSAAFRAMLGEEVTATAAGVAPSPRHRSRRTAMLVTLATLVALVVTGTAAVALTGGTLLGDPAPVATTSAPTPIPADTPTPTATPTPTPTPTAPPAPAAPVPRVPDTCENLLPQAAAEELAGAVMVPSVRREFGNPVSYTNQRIGVLACGFSGGNHPDEPFLNAYASIAVYPDITPEGFLQEAQREGEYIATPEPEIGSSAYSSCRTEIRTCNYIGLAGDYAIEVRVHTDAERTMTEDERAAVRGYFADALYAASSYGPPTPLWQPPGGTIAGANSCDELIEPDALAAILGVGDVYQFKSEEGEYATSSFDSQSQVGAYWCSWADENPQSTVATTIAVLPGGAGYFSAASTADPDLDWVPTTDYPGEAYISSDPSYPDRSRVTILIDGAWLQVGSMNESLPTIVDAVLANLGAG